MPILVKKKLAPLATALCVCASISSPALSAQMTCSSATTYVLSDAVDKMCYFGNDTPTVTSTYSMFGKTNWVLSDKHEGGDGTNVIQFATAPVIGDKSGTWLLDTLAGYTSVVLTLKAGIGWGAFLLDLTTANPLSGVWGSDKDLSHASVYYNGAPSPVPLPAGLPLLLTALGALGLVSRRRKK